MSNTTAQTVVPGEIKKLYLTAETSSVFHHRFHIYRSNPDHSLKFIGFKLQVEKSPYPTLFNEGTRLAPNVPIKGLLPKYGTISAEGEFIYSPDETTYLYSEHGSYLLISPTAQIQGSIYGTTFSHPFPESWPDNTFKSFK